MVDGVRRVGSGQWESRPRTARGQAAAERRLGCGGPACSVTERKRLGYGRARLVCVTAGEAATRVPLQSSRAAGRARLSAS